MRATPKRSIELIDPLEQQDVPRLSREMPARILPHPIRHLPCDRGPSAEYDGDDVILVGERCKHLRIHVSASQPGIDIPVDLPAAVCGNLLLGIELPDQIPAEIGAVEESPLQARQLVQNVARESIG